MLKKNLLLVDVPTRLNLTYAMIIVSWEKRKVLNVMARTCHKYGK